MRCKARMRRRRRNRKPLLHQYEKMLASTETAVERHCSTVDLPKLNQQLKQAGLNEISQAAEAVPEIDDGDNERER